MRYKCWTLFIGCFCFASIAAGQEIFTVKGVVSKKLSAERVAQAVISNLRSKEIMMSDELGWFAIKAAIGDTLSFNKIDYTEQKIVIAGPGDIPVYMQPVIKLNEVAIKGQSKKQELQEVLNEYNRKGVYYNGKPPLASILLNPLNDLHLLFGRDAANLRRFKTFSKEEIEFAEVQRRYNVAFVMRVTSTADSTAKKFMRYYTPSYNNLKGWSDYDLISNVKKSYAYYDKNGSAIKLEDLQNPALVKPKMTPDQNVRVR